MVDLLGEKPEKPRKEKKQKPDTDPAVARCIKAFYDTYVKRWNPGLVITPDTPKKLIITPLVHGAKHGAQFKKLLAAWDEETVLELIALFFSTRDSKITGTDYSLDKFFIHAQYLRLKAVRALPGADQRTDENMEAAMRASGRKA